MATYKYKDIERALLACGFEPMKNNNGSHQMYVDKTIGFAQPLPKHSNGVIAPGTAESILDYATMVARLKNINICSDRYKLSDDVTNYIKKQHAKIKKSLMFLIPDAIKKQRGIKTIENVKQFIKLFFSKCKPKKLANEFSM